MGKSTSCFKVITCGGDSKDHEDNDVPQNTADKRGWSFRKRSGRQRVLSNSAITESPDLNVQQTANSVASDKNSATDCINEKPQLSCPEDSKAIEVVVSTHDVRNVDGQLEESILIVIQTAIRGLLAQIALKKLKNVIKLQAAVRGHIVRRHAVGTLQCVQAIVKMQALVRSRYSRQSLGGPHQYKLDSNRGEDVNSSCSKTLEKEESNKSKVTYISIEKLLNNRFAHQLLDSTPKTTPINIKCDPLKSDSAWKWLERWMSVSSVDTCDQKKTETIEEKAGNEKKEKFVPRLNNGIDTDSANGISIEKKSALPSVVKANLIICDAESLKVQACDGTSSSLLESLELSQCGNTSVSDIKDLSMKADTTKSSPDQMAQSRKAYPQLQCDSDLEKHDTENDQSIMEEILSEELENDGMKSVIGLRNATNPSLIADQTRFEELSSTVNSGKPTSLFLEEENMKSYVEKASSPADIALETKELDSSEIVTLSGSKLIHFGGSESGTELSISSTLDSPDRCDSGTFELQHDVNVVGEDTPDSNKTKNTEIEEVDVTLAISVSNLSQPILDEPTKTDIVISESIISEASTDPVKIEETADRNTCHQQIEVDTETGNQACRLSPEASPRSHITGQESQGTPSSQLSVKANKNKIEKSGSNLKRKSLSANKKSHSNNIHNSGSISSPDHLPKDQKIGKRRNSFGSPKPDSIEQESRDSTSNNSVPRFMQATESARAKVHSNNSPRSSPDIQDRDIYIKKRNSLSGTNGRQESPRIQRSMSQAKQTAKGNESKWQR